MDDRWIRATGARLAAWITLRLEVMAEVLSDSHAARYGGWHWHLPRWAESRAACCCLLLPLYTLKFKHAVVLLGLPFTHGRCTVQYGHSPFSLCVTDLTSCSRAEARPSPMIH
jgi:hypothetical protein